MAGLTLFALTVGDGILAISPLPGGGGDYASDLELLHEWRPSIVVSMTTEAEMEHLGASHLGHDVQEHGARWMHLPIEDFGAPTTAIEAKWLSVSRAALAALRGGGRVLVHCRGGCGRSGMVALRLMIESGEAPDLALARLRKIRPCAVETDAQMAWAVRGSRT
jgi:protein-tyrosine phosphatase